MTLEFDEWPLKTIGHVFYTTSTFVNHFVAIGESILELQSGNAQSGSNSTIFFSRVTLKFDGWPWKTIGTSPKQHQAVCIISSQYVNSNRSYGPETAKWGHDLCGNDLWPWPFAWWEHSQKGVTDGRTDGRADGLNHSYSCLVAAKNAVSQKWDSVANFNILHFRWRIHCSLVSGWHISFFLARFDKNVLLVRRQAISWINADFRPIRARVTNLLIAIYPRLRPLLPPTAATDDENEEEESHKDASRNDELHYVTGNR